MIYLKDKVESGFQEAAGFHITSWPPNACLEKKTKYHIQFSQANLAELVRLEEQGGIVGNPADKSLAGSQFMTRSMYDRIVITYRRN